MKTELSIYKKEAWNKVSELYGDDWLKNGISFICCNEMVKKSIPPNVNGHIKILDNACGPGSLPLNLIEYLSQKENVTFTIDACDHASKMIEKLDRNLCSKSIPNGSIKSHVMDGQNLEFPDETFDYVFSMFGLVFFPSIDKGLQSMNRVLKSGGTIGISTWAYGGFIQSFFEGYRDAVGHEWDGEEIVKLSTEGEVIEAMERNGFTDIKTSTYITPMVDKSVEELYYSYIEAPMFQSILGGVPEDKAMLFEKLVIEKLHLLKQKRQLVNESIIAIGKK
ncbi:putative SAM dependent methyltransferase [Tieghemostelium lacteum]|uniref:Putative SAM dependent methyltransferase n=1 Tax=Tieghemostelium lacteum TaxID=361077 RepID=A0A151ZSU7_TIELA|nr:putative SAM dependent methyltransferase [Tieghemostelium lacteum]|eukprot:KYQ96854.1 putative SAM dependent methyltransferase [Tieghemostelium lacteum]